METPRYHREQAEDCLELARLMSDPHSARILRSAAARHFEQACELEKLTVVSPSIAPEKQQLDKTLGLYDGVLWQTNYLLDGIVGSVT